MLTHDEIATMQRNLQQQAATLQQQLDRTLGAVELCEHWLSVLDARNTHDEPEQDNAPVNDQAQEDNE